MLRKIGMGLIWLASVAAAVLIFFFLSLHWLGLVEAHWDQKYASADPSVQAWYERAKLTDAAQARLGFVSCCAHSDVVKTQFRVAHNNGADQWWWLDNGQWQRIPDDIIHWGESAPDGQPTLFAIGDGEPTCFYPGDSGN